MGEMKTCTKCGGDPRPLTEFSKHSGKPGGLQSHCKSCVKAYNAKHYADNREERKATDAKYYADNREKCNAATSQWRVDNPEARRIIGNNYRARKRANGGKLSKDIAGKLFTLQRGKCACGCREPLGDKYHLDHRMPLALGGANEDFNIQLLRQHCNNQKGAIHPNDFMRQRGYLL